MCTGTRALVCMFVCFALQLECRSFEASKEWLIAAPSAVRNLAGITGTIGDVHNGGKKLERWRNLAGLLFVSSKKF